MKSFMYAVLLSMASIPATYAAELADIAYTNGKVYTVNEAQPWAEAVAIKDGKFLAVGSVEQITEVTDETTEVINLKGGFAMPGLHDSHAHPTLVYVYKEAGDLLFPESTPPAFPPLKVEAHRMQHVEFAPYGVEAPLLAELGAGAPLQLLLRPPEKVRQALLVDVPRRWRVHVNEAS